MIDRTKTYIMCLMTYELDTFYKYKKKFGKTNYGLWKKEDRIRISKKYRELKRKFLSL